MRIIAASLFVFVSLAGNGITLPVCEVAERAQREVSTYPGRVVPIAQVDVTPQVSGEILEVCFANGAEVKEGDVLYRLDPVKYEAAVKNAESKLAECKANARYIWDLRQKGDKESALLVSRISELTRIPSKDIAEYINITRFDDAFINSLGSKKCCGEVEDEDSEPFDTFNISVEYPEKMAFDIPHGAKQAVNVERLFDDSEFEFRGDTLTFRISLDDIYTFTVDRRTLKQDTTKSIKSDRATLAISNLHAAEWSPTSRILRITGILFIE